MFLKSLSLSSYLLILTAVTTFNTKHLFASECADKTRLTHRTTATYVTAKSLVAALLLAQVKSCPRVASHTDAVVFTADVTDKLVTSDSCFVVDEHGTMMLHTGVIAPLKLSAVTADPASLRAAIADRAKGFAWWCANPYNIKTATYWEEAYTTYAMQRLSAGKQVDIDNLVLNNPAPYLGFGKQVDLNLGGVTLSSRSNWQRVCHELLWPHFEAAIDTPAEQAKSIRDDWSSARKLFDVTAIEHAKKTTGGFRTARATKPAQFKTAKLRPKGHSHDHRNHTCDSR